MDRTARELVIDARPRGPRGPLAGEHVQGRSVLDLILDLAETVSKGPRPVSVHARRDDHPALAGPISARGPGRFLLVDGPPAEGAAVLSTDRLYDPARLRRALRRGGEPGSAVIWRLDTPGALEVAGEELTRRQSYQPLGRYWALGPARWLARALAPTRARPNAVTLAAAFLMLASAALVAFSGSGLWAAAAMASALVLDTADGHLARLQGTASAFGRWLDAWLDELCDMALHAAIAWAAYSRTGAAGWLMVGMLYAAGKYVFVVGATVTDRDLNDAGSPPPAPIRSPVRDAVRMAGHADVRWHLWIVLAAAGRLEWALAAYAGYYPARSLLGAAGKAVRRG